MGFCNFLNLHLQVKGKFSGMGWVSDFKHSAYGEHLYPIHVKVTQKIIFIHMHFSPALYHPAMF